MGRLFLRFFFSVLLAVFVAAIGGALILLWARPDLSATFSAASTQSADESPVIILPKPTLSVALLRIVPTIVSLIVVSYILARRLAKPMEKLRAGIRRFAAGDLQYRVAPEIGKRKDEIGDLASEFDQMAARVETLVQTQRRLLRDISHELRSPLARQRVAIQLLREKLGEVDGNESIDRIEREAGRLDEMIDELLTLARLEGGDQVVFATAPVDLTALMQDVVADANFEAQRTGKAVTLAQLQYCIVNGSPELLRRAFENVLRNAIRHTDDGTTVNVDMITSTSNVSVEVRDFGPGVAPEKLGDIFKPFFRIDEARERTRGGAGIGLAIVERAVNRHGGRVSAHNATDGGLIVRIELPLSQQTL